MSYQQDQVREWAYVYGSMHPDHEWICSPLDSWEKNPHYTGKPGRHPEDDYEGEQAEAGTVTYSPMFEPDADDIPF